MESRRRWTVVAAGAAVLALGACSATGPTQARGEPALRFTRPADAGNGCRDDDGRPARVRRDAYGRRIYFREIPLDRHGAVRDAGALQDVACVEAAVEADGSAERRGASDGR